MREILFRGKRKDNGEWVEGSLYESNDNRLYVIPKQTLWITKSDGDTMRSVYGAHDIINSSIGQFTGLTDKNGIKVFEGDIIEEGYNNMADRWVTNRWIVKWNQIQMAWMCYSDERSPYPTRANVICTNKNVIKVVGNIYDNKE